MSETVVVGTPERKFTVLLAGDLVCTIWVAAVEEHAGAVVFRRGPMIAGVEKRPGIALVERKPTGETQVIWKSTPDEPQYYWRNWNWL